MVALILFVSIVLNTLFYINLLVDEKYVIQQEGIRQNNQTELVRLENQLKTNKKIVMAVYLISLSGLVLILWRDVDQKQKG